MNKAKVISFYGIVSLLFLAAGAQSSFPKVGNAHMYPHSDIIENAEKSEIHTTFMQALRAADLVDILKGPGPFTVFAPTNEAFAKLPSQMLEVPLRPENKAMLNKILTYHVLNGTYTIKKLTDEIRKKSDGKIELITMQGGKIFATFDRHRVVLTDERGGQAKIRTTDLTQKNGLIQVIDGVLMPKD